MALPKDEDDEIGEILYNGEPINWVYWASRRNIEPRQAAILAHSIDPIKWSDGSFNNGQWPDSLRTKIQYLYEWLSDRADSYTISSLVVALGDRFAPYGMKEAAQVRKEENIPQAAPAEGNPVHQPTKAPVKQSCLMTSGSLTIEGDEKGANSWKYNWIKPVREIALRLYEEAQQKKWGTDQESIAGEVAKECDGKVFTDKGKPLTASYILRHALTPWDIPQISLANRQK